MQITLNTAEEITDLDRQVLGLLAGGSFILNGEPQTFLHDKTDDIARDGPKSEANTKLICSLRYAVSDNAVNTHACKSEGQCGKST